MIWPAFLVGALGSLHCIGMCGPLALSLPIPKDKNRYLGITLYNFGRIITYGILGFLFGSFGSLFAMAELQQLLSILSGIILVFIASMSLMKISNGFYFEKINRIIAPITNSLRIYLKQYTFSSLFMIGMLNGFLPCGLVYMAIVGAVVTGSPLSGAAFMMLFGAGTMPAMFLLSSFSKTISGNVRFKFTKLTPYIVGFLGLILVFRGLNLGIPYISPEISSVKLTASHCCTKQLLK